MLDLPGLRQGEIIKFYMGWVEVPALLTPQDIPVPCHLDATAFLVTPCAGHHCPRAPGMCTAPIADLSDHGPKGSATGRTGIRGFFSLSLPPGWGRLSRLGAPRAAERVGSGCPQQPAGPRLHYLSGAQG